MLRLQTNVSWTTFGTLLQNTIADAESIQFYLNIHHSVQFTIAVEDAVTELEEAEQPVPVEHAAILSYHLVSDHT